MNANDLHPSTFSRPVAEVSSFPDAELITAKELARLLAISERTLYRLKSMGEIPNPVTLGGSVRWRLTEIREWILKGCPIPAASK